MQADDAERQRGAGAANAVYDNAAGVELQRPRHFDL